MEIDAKLRKRESYADGLARKYFLSKYRLKVRIARGNTLWKRGDGWVEWGGGEGSDGVGEKCSSQMDWGRCEGSGFVIVGKAKKRNPALGSFLFALYSCAVVQNSHELRHKFLATRWFVRLFIRTSYSFAHSLCLRILLLSFIRSLTPELVGKLIRCPKISLFLTIVPCK